MARTVLMPVVRRGAGGAVVTLGHCILDHADAARPSIYVRVPTAAPQFAAQAGPVVDEAERMVRFDTVMLRDGGREWRAIEVVPRGPDASLLPGFDAVR